MLRRALYIISVLLFVFVGAATAQCPVNMGFDLGNFTNWTGYIGTIDRMTYQITVPTEGIVPDRHTIITRASKYIDPYGKFLVASPNGSSTCVQLGNAGTGAEAERLTYTINVPLNVTDYSLIYYYAVVFQNPGHTEAQQPRFTANVFDVTLNKYAECGAFKFVASGGLAGFKTSPVSSGVQYKEWSPVTINLLAYAGKTIRLEFTTNDCAPGGHFGYAYIDVNQNCFSPVTGNVVCENTNYIKLEAPSGFAGYKWFNGTDFSKVIATGNTYIVSPAPPVGTQYSVAIEPFPGIGCADTILTTIKSPENLSLKVTPALAACKFTPIDITKANITAGSDASFSFTYHTDAAGTQFISDPTAILDSGTYYIKATSPSGCAYIKPIKLSFLPTPNLVLANPPPVCKPNTVDITAFELRKNSLNAPNISYWADDKGTIPVTAPNALAKSGTYYIKSTNSIGCYDIKPITVLVNEVPSLTTSLITGCNTANITVAAATKGSLLFDATLSYWKDAAAIDTLLTPAAIPQSGRYYIKATTSAGCYDIKPIDVLVYPYPVSTITDPPAVIFPATVDITHSFTRQTGTAYYYYIDSLGTKLLPDATRISVRGTYYIKAVNGNECEVMFPVIVTIKPPDVVDYGVNTFTPNGDGNNDVFRIKLTNSVKLNHFRVYSSWGALLFETDNYLKGWDGTNNGKKMPVGTYYWIVEGYDNYLNKPIKQSGSVTIVM